SLARIVEDRGSRIEDRSGGQVPDLPPQPGDHRSSIIPPPSSSKVRWIWGAGLAVASLGLGCIIGTRFVQAAQTEYAWNAFYRLVPDDASGSAHPSALEARVRWLTVACDNGSTDPDHYLRLGLANLEMFLQKRKQAASPAGLLQARKILQQGRFADAGDARAWLQSRYGDDLLLLEKAHAALNRSLTCCPLLGDAYLHSAKLSFLDNPVRPAP